MEEHSDEAQDMVGCRGSWLRRPWTRPARSNSLQLRGMGRSGTQCPGASAQTTPYCERPRIGARQLRSAGGPFFVSRSGPILASAEGTGQLDNTLVIYILGDNGTSAEGGIGKGGLGTICVNDKQVAEGRIERTQPMFFSADETADVGVDEAMPVTEDYKKGDNAFSGRVHKVTIAVGAIGAGTQVEAAKAGAETAKKLEAAK